MLDGNNDGYIITIEEQTNQNIEIDNFGPLYEKGVRVNDIILEINEEEGTWSNLTKSLRFAGLGNNIQLKVSSENSSLKVIDISADQTKKIN